MMEEEKLLYPMKFCVLQDDYSWGSEEFRISDLGYRDSLVREGWLAGNSIGEVMDMYVDRVVGENVFGFYGRQFPVCVRRITVKGRMPLRVNPDDVIAGERYDFLGKEKLWYVVEADGESGIMLGFRRDTDATELLEKCEDGSVEGLMNIVRPHSGQCFHIAPGVPHAAFGNMQILEIAESSPLDFCLCGWGEQVSDVEFDPSLSAVDALDFIRYTKYEEEKPVCGCGGHHHEDEPVHKLADIPQFTVNRLNLSDPLHIYSEKFESFILYSCVSGEASVQVPVMKETASYELKAGETILVPAECPDFFLVPIDRSSVVVETTVHREEIDSYTNEHIHTH
ncbi:MAG: hypothetical protein MJY89_05660 [Bacteroidales bacterium]|nr:hypothetical protein [Bacteroidales bacterium]